MMQYSWATGGFVLPKLEYFKATELTENTEI
jgi:hypothetical protein